MIRVIRCEAMGNAEKAAEFFKKAADQRGTTRWSQTRFYQGLSLMKLNQKDSAEDIFDDLIKSGRQRLSERQAGDFFAKFGEGQTSEAQKASAHFTVGLGYLGKVQNDAARAEFEKAVDLDVSNVWAGAYLAQLK